jgi:hypothetical protein
MNVGDLGFIQQSKINNQQLPKRERPSPNGRFREL